jgi:hypothetical protein
MDFHWDARDPDRPMAEEVTTFIRLMLRSRRLLLGPDSDRLTMPRAARTRILATCWPRLELFRSEILCLAIWMRQQLRLPDL